MEAFLSDYINMEILINEKPIDFELDKKLSLPELLDNIQEWASRENLFILDYKVNGSVIEDDGNHYNSDNIQFLEINIGTKQMLIWESINELQNYLSRTSSYLLPRLQESVKVMEIDKSMVSKGINWVKNSIASLRNHFSLPGYSLHEIDEEQLSISLEKENYVELLTTIKAILVKLDLCKKQLFYNMLTSMEASDLKVIYIPELISVIARLDEIASDLTVGKDLKALNGLENIIEWLSIGLLVFEKSGTDIQVIESVKKTLNDLEQSLKNSDFVSLADIVDFDLRESLSALI